MRHLFEDLRYAVRTLARAPGFTFVAVLTLALGIGANTAIFSLVYALLLKPLPFRDPSRLIALWDTHTQIAKVGVSPLEVDSIKRQTDLFEQTAWYRYVPKNLNLITPASPAAELHATFIAPNLLPTLGVAPALGRPFSANESPQSALLNHQLWESRFGADPAVIGKSIHLDDQSFTIIGVMPLGFQFPDSTELWLPPGPLLRDELTNPVRHSLGVLVRLRAGVTPLQARARCNPCTGGLPPITRKPARASPSASRASKPISPPAPAQSYSCSGARLVWFYSSHAETWRI